MVVEASLVCLASKRCVSVWIFSLLLYLGLDGEPLETSQVRTAPVRDCVCVYVCVWTIDSRGSNQETAHWSRGTSAIDHIATTELSLLMKDVLILDRTHGPCFGRVLTGDVTRFLAIFMCCFVTTTCVNWAVRDIHQRSIQVQRAVVVQLMIHYECVLCLCC